MNDVSLLLPPESIVEFLGDKHNFGVATSKLESGVLWKPRRCFWESSFLAPNGRLRMLLRQKLFQSSPHKILDLLPKVDYQVLGNQTCLVKPVSFSSLSGSLNLENWEGLGAVLAISKFFGWQDLHIENMAFGYHDDGEIFAGPIDLECTFTQISKLNETHLIPIGGLKPTFAGLAPLKNRMLKSSPNALAVLIGSYLASVQALVGSRLEFLNLITDDALQEPIRVVLRPTGYYVNLLQTSHPLDSFNENLLAEEIIQMKRHEVPYFCCFWGKNELMYYSDPGILTPVASSQWSSIVGNRMPMSILNAASNHLEEDINSIVEFFSDGLSGTSTCAGVKLTLQKGKYQIDINGFYIPINSIEANSPILA